MEKGKVRGIAALFAALLALVLAAFLCMGLPVREANAAESLPDGAPEGTVAGVVQTSGDKETFFDTVYGAFNAANHGATINIYSDVSDADDSVYSTGQAWLYAKNKSLTVNGNGHILTATSVNYPLYYRNDYTTEESYKLVVNNLTIVGKGNAECGIILYGERLALELNKVTLDTSESGKTYPYNPSALLISGRADATAQAIDVTVDVDISGSTLKTSDVGRVIKAENPVDLTIKENSTLSGWSAIYMCRKLEATQPGAIPNRGTEHSTITITDSTVSTKSVHNGDDNKFDAIVFEDGNITLGIVNSDIVAEATGTSPQSVIYYSGYYAGTHPSSIDIDITDTDITLTGASFVGTGALSDFPAADRDVEVAGGTFNFEVPEDYLADGFELSLGADGSYTVVDTKETVATITRGEKTYWYESLDAAFAAAQNGDTVTLLADVTESVTIAEGKTVTLDLNGRTIANTQEQGQYATITNHGTLIIDGSNGGAVKATSAAKMSYKNEDDYIPYAVYNYGTLTAKNATITAEATASGTSTEDLDRPTGSVYIRAYGIYNDAGSATLENCTVSASSASTSSYAVYNTKGALSITDGAFTAGKADLTTSGTPLYSENSGSSVTVNGGTFTANGKSPYGIYVKFAEKAEITGATVTSSKVGIYFYNLAGTAKLSDSTVTVNATTSKSYNVHVIGCGLEMDSVQIKTTASGSNYAYGVYTSSLKSLTIKGNSSIEVTAENGPLLPLSITGTGAEANLEQCSIPNGAIEVYSGVTVNISGGEFGDVELDVRNGAFRITGGTFKSVPDLTMLADNYAIYKEDGKYVVKEDNGDATLSKNDAAMIGDTGYSSLSAAIGAAQEGQTVILLKSVEEDVTVSSGTVTLDLNGNTLTGNISVSGGSLSVVGSGKVTGTVGASDGTLRISGGSYANLIAADYLAEGYVLKAGRNTDGVLTAEVVKGTPMASMTIGETEYEFVDLASALSAAPYEQSSEIILLQSITLDGDDTLTINLQNKEIVLNLGGNTIEATAEFNSGNSPFITVANGAKLTIRNGKIVRTAPANDSAVALIDVHSYNELSPAELTLEKDLTIEQSGNMAIYIYGYATLNTAANIHVTGDSVIQSNGSEEYAGKTVINITGGELTSDDDVAIFHPQNGELNISGGTVSGATAIYMRSGSLTVSGNAVIKATGAKYEGYPESGYAVTGDAIVIRNSNYPGGAPEPDITGGTISSENASAVVSTAVAGAVAAVNFISGGTFSGELPLAYLADETAQIAGTDGNYTVGSYDDLAETANAVAVVKEMGKAYASLQTAIDEANAGATVTLLGNVTGNVSINKSVTLDLGGFTLTDNGNHTITNYGTLIVTGEGTVDNVTHGRAALVNYGTATLSGGTFTRSLEAGTYNGVQSNGNSYYAVENFGILTVDGATVTTRTLDGEKAVGGYSSLIRSTNNKDAVTDVPSVIIKSGKLVGGMNTVKIDAGTLRIEGGELVNYAQNVVMTYGTETVITGGTLTLENPVRNDGGNCAVIYASSDTYGTEGSGTVTIEGGTLKVVGAATDAVISGVRAVANAEVTINDVTFDTQSGSFDIEVLAEGSAQVSVSAAADVDVPAGAVASVETDGMIAYFTALEEALAAAKNGGTVVLLADIEQSITIGEGRNITLDLNGFTLTNTAGSHTIINNGTLMVIDGSAKKTGTVTNVTSGKAAFYNGKNADATLSGGTFTRTAANNYYVIQNHGTMEINDGVTMLQPSKSSSGIASGWYTPGEESQRTYLTINGGTFASNGITVKNDEINELTITGGTFDNVVGYSANQSVQNWAIGAITGGTFYSNIYSWAYENDSGDVVRGDLTISGSDVVVRGKIEAYYLSASGAQTIDESGEVLVEEGMFYNPVRKSYLSDASALGYNAENGTYTIVASEEPQAQIERGDAVYAFATLADAIAAAKNGDTVVLLGNVNLTEALTIDKNVTIDLAGHTIGAEGTAANITADTTIKSSEDGGAIVYTGEGADNGLVVTKNATLTLENVTVDYKGAGQAIRLGDYNGGTPTADGGNAVLTNATVTGGVAGVAMFGTAEGSANKTSLTATASTISGTVYYGIATNGIFYNNVISLTDTNVSAPETTGTAMYLPGSGETTITGGEIKGATGIEIRAGKLTVNEGTTVTATGAYTEPVPNPSGTTISGVAIAVSQHTTERPIDVTVNGGTFNATGADGKAFLEIDTVRNEGVTPSEGVAVSIVDGEFNASVEARNITGFISGGKFSKLPAEDLFAEGLAGELYNGYYVVVKADTEVATVADRMEAQNEMRGYLAAFGLTLIDMDPEDEFAAAITEAYEAIFLAETRSDVAKALAAGLDAVDAYKANLDFAKAAAQTELVEYSMGDNGVALVVVPTYALSAINAAVSVGEIETYVAAAKAEMDDIRAQRAEAEEQFAAVNAQLEAVMQALGITGSAEEGYTSEVLEKLNGVIEALGITEADGAWSTDLLDGITADLATANDNIAAMQKLLGSATDEATAQTIIGMIKATQDRVTEAEKNITDLVGKLSSDISDKYEALAGAVAALPDSETVNGLAEQLKQLSGTVDSMQGSVSSIGSSIEKIDATVTQINKAQTELKAAVEGYVAAADKALNGLQTALNNANTALDQLTGALLNSAKDGLADEITAAQNNINSILQSIALLPTTDDVEAALAAIVEDLAAVQTTVDSIAGTVSASTAVEEAKTDALDEIRTWLNGYLDDIIGGDTAQAGIAVQRMAYTEETTDGEIYGKLTQAFSEENANLVLRYYNEALAAIDAATTVSEVTTAVSTFRAQVASVEAAAQNTPGLTGVYVLLAVVLVLVIVACIIMLVKGRREVAEQAAPAAEPVQKAQPEEAPAAAEEAPAEEVHEAQPEPQPEPAQEAPAQPEAEEDDDKEKIVIAANVRSFSEAYMDLDEEQRGLFGKVKDYALAKEGAVEVKQSGGVCIKRDGKQIVKLMVRRNMPVALFLLENEMLKDFRRNAKSEAKLKVRATELVIRDEEDLETAYTMVDLSVDQIEKDIEAAKERRREARRQRRLQRQAEEAAAKAQADEAAAEQAPASDEGGKE